MEAMILAAGRGSRLMPLTKDKPKALVEVAGCTLLHRNITKLINSNVRHIVINTHYLGELIHRFVEKQNYDAKILFSDEEESLLDTGGGVWAARKLFSGTQPILLHNVDVVSDIDFADMERQLLNSDALAMIAVSSRETSRHLLFDSQKHLCGRDNQTLNQTTLLPEREAAYSYAFGGVHILRPQIFDYFTHRGTFSIIDEYLSLAKDHHIDPIMHNAQTWFDVGKIEHLSAIEEAIKANPNL